MKHSRRLIAIVVALFPLIGSCASTGDECDVCTADIDCKEGLVCWTFSGETTTRCASGLGTTVCRVR
jgi:hypothetical protein